MVRPISITVDKGTELYNRAIEAWVYQYGVQLDFIRTGKPVENSYIESFNGRLRDECLTVQVFLCWPMFARNSSCGVRITTRCDPTVRWMTNLQQSSLANC